MTILKTVFIRDFWARRVLPFAFLVAPFASGCGHTSNSESAKTAPAKVELLPRETELSSLKLTLDAIQRLGIQLVPAEMRTVSRHRTFAGEAIVPSGKSIVATSPVSGLVESSGDWFPQAGSEVKAGQSLLVVKPLLSPEREVPTPAEQLQMTGAKANLMVSLVTAQADIARGESEVQGLQITRNRAAKLLEDRAGSRRAFDDAEAQLSISKSTLAGAKQREQELLSILRSIDDSSSGEGNHDPVAPLTIKAPVTGVVRNVQVSASQKVTAGAPLIEVVDLSTIWIRVPVYVDLLRTLNRESTVNLVSLNGTPLANSSPKAHPFAAPPTADASSSSADLYYEVDNRELNLRPGQRVGVDLPLTSEVAALVIPTSAVLYDIYGSTWVYIQTAENEVERKFTRCRVLIEWVDGNQAIASKGPDLGALMVTDGAAELFSIEFGAGK